ncbi:MAG: L-threonylcarbamoyladenylate synthase [Candidatus Anstonellaceae archaeon]
MPTKLSLSSDYDLAKESAKSILSADGLLVYPTDTLYGLGCNALSQKAVDKIYELKARDQGKPLSMVVADFPMLLEYCTVSESQEKILHSLLPGPYTFILPLRRKLPVSPSLSAGIRVPEHRFMRQVAKELGFPIVSTSANISGKKDSAEADGVDAEVASAVDLIIDGGKCKYAQGSTIIDLVSMKIVRKGAVRDGDKFEWAKE